ncbi:MAG: hypothetical protein HY430_01895 [Candidatus Levybacteria bacterium]|nr:hypothetical protein [Candidatus Levybacteria bacterium]
MSLEIERFDDKEKRDVCPVVIDSFEDIPLPNDPQQSKIQQQLIHVSKKWGLTSMQDVAHHYIQLYHQQRGETGEQVLFDGEPVTLPKTELEVTWENVWNAYKQLASGALISWILLHNQGFCVPMPPEDTEAPEMIVESLKEEGGYSFRRVLPSGFYFELTNRYLDQLREVQQWHEQTENMLGPTIIGIVNNSLPEKFYPTN